MTVVELLFLLVTRAYHWVGCMLNSLPHNVRLVAAHGLERLLGAALCSSRAAQVIHDGVPNDSAAINSSKCNERVQQVAAQLQVALLQAITTDAADLMRFSDIFRSIL